MEIKLIHLLTHLFKKISVKKILLVSLALPLIIVACDNEGKDSVEKADSANEAKSDLIENYRDTSNRKGHWVLMKLLRNLW